LILAIAIQKRDKKERFAGTLQRAKRSFANLKKKTVSTSGTKRDQKGREPKGKVSAIQEKGIPH
tara:strand:+ start:317 stop:508 length:192 start_codon:yes stop_codon:yes gene_type:complete